MIMSPLFSNEKLPRFLVQRDTTPRLDVCAVSSECAFTASKSFPQEKKVIFSSVSLWVILAAVSVHRHPSPTESSSVVSWTPSWRISQNYKHTQIQMYVCPCSSQQSQGVSPMHFHKEIIFEMKSVKSCLW